MQPEDREQKIKILETLLKYTTETSLADYKSAVQFVEDGDFALKLIRHVLGFANAGGGHIIIGFAEDDKKIPRPDINMSDQILSSYETTRFTQYVNAHVEGQEKVDLTIWKVSLGEVKYPIIEIKPFARDPFFCKSTKKDSSNQEILKEGTLYIRDVESKTVKVADSKTWRKLIATAMKNRNDELLERFKDLINDIKNPDQDNSKEDKIKKHKSAFKEWTKNLSRDVETVLQKEGFSLDRWEISHWLIDTQKVWSQNELLEAAKRATLHRTGWPVGLVVYNDRTRPTAEPDGVKEVIVAKNVMPFFPSLDYWYLREDGAYFFARNFMDEEEYAKNKRLLYFDTRIWRIAEGIEHCLHLYKELGVAPETKIHIKIIHKGLKDRILTAGNQMRAFTMWDGRRSNADETIWEMEATLDEIEVRIDDFVIQVVKKVFVLFDFWVPDPGVIEGVLKEYHSARI